MIEVYNRTIERGNRIFHQNYSLYNYYKTIAFDAGVVRLITLDFNSSPSKVMVSVFFIDGDNVKWTTKWISSYNFQFGIAVSLDGKYIFVQTWERGMLCLDSRTGEKIWQTKSKRGITSIFVNDNTVLCHWRERALQLLDIHTGEILLEKRPATAWGFTAINHNYIVCRVTARKWEIIDAATLKTKQEISHREFTGGHEEYCINYIKLVEEEIIVRGFKNVWDETVSPAKILPNLKFEHRVSVDYANCPLD